MVWGALLAGLDAVTAAPGGGCVTRERTSVRLRATCTDTGPKPPRRAELQLDRSTSGGAGVVTATVLPTS